MMKISGIKALMDLTLRTTKQAVCCSLREHTAFVVVLTLLREQPSLTQKELVLELERIVDRIKQNTCSNQTFLLYL